MSENNDSWSWKTRWVIRRNRILGSAAFQRWASRTPLIRIIARRKASAQFDLIAGFIYSQILAAYVESGLIEYLAGDVRRFADIATFTALSDQATERLLRAGAALQLSESPQPGLWALGEGGAALSVNAGAMAMIRHHHLLYRDLAAPLGLLANDREEDTALSAYWTYAAKGAARESAANGPDYSALMAATQPMVAQQIIDAYDFSKHRRMLDIGGGSGAFTAAVAAMAPNGAFGIFDLPEVIAQAAARVGAALPEVAMHPGSFKEDAIPHGYDLITLVRILHDHDDDVVQVLLAAVYAALPASGRLLIVEPMADAPHARRMGDAYFGMYLWAMSSGRPRSMAENIAMLKQAGFASVKPVKTALPIIASALVATK